MLCAANLLRPSLWGALLLTAAFNQACTRKAVPPTPTASANQALGAAATTHCLANGTGELKARLRGALDARLAWQDGVMECVGGARPDRSGIRVSIAGPLDATGHRLRFVFGVKSAPGTAQSANVPTNLTIIQEGAQRLFTTLGDDKCQSERLTQRLEDPAHPHVYVVEAHGYCIGPAATLDHGAQLWLDSFDLRARIDTEEKDTP